MNVTSWFDWIICKNVISTFSCYSFRWVGLPSCCFLFRAWWLSRFPTKIIAMFQLGLFFIILTNLVMPNTQTLIGLSWNIGSFISISFVYSPFKLIVNLAYRNITISCKLLLNAINNWSLRSIHKFSKVICMSIWVWGCFRNGEFFKC